ncbi:MAG: CopG family transcriptional regulator, partial [Tropicimonas sp.]
MHRTEMNRRPIRAFAALLVAAGLPVLAQAAGADTILQVHKDPGCGCCGAWVDQARSRGFEVEVTETADYAGMKRAAGVPDTLLSCHTAT